MKNININTIEDTITTITANITDEVEGNIDFDINLNVVEEATTEDEGFVAIEIEIFGAEVTEDNDNAYDMSANIRKEVRKFLADTNYDYDLDIIADIKD